MVDFNQWLQDQKQIERISTTSRAIMAWRRIQRVPQVITLVRNGTPLSAQTMRVELGTSVNESGNEGGVNSAVRSGTLFGVKGHPAIADTDIQRGDLFNLNGTKYRVAQVNATFPGEIQADVEAFA